MDRKCFSGILMSFWWCFGVPALHFGLPAIHFFSYTPTLRWCHFFHSSTLSIFNHILQENNLNIL